jgi:SPP1 gp7 family putative phage head morphogenesis protein
MTWQEKLRDLAQRMYDGEFDDLIDPAMVRETADEFMNAVEKGFGMSMDEDGISAADYKLLEALQQNVFHFSGAKNWNQLQEMSALLTDKDNIQSFEDFFEGVKAIDDTYNKTYAKVEFQQAHNASYSIRKWDTIQKEKATLPKLRWQTTDGENVCPICEGLDDLCLDVDDPFWNRNFPPRHFGCNCEVIQEDGDATGKALDEVTIKPIAPMFQINPGIEKVVFSDKAPYFESIPQHEKMKVLKASENLIKK